MTLFDLPAPAPEPGPEPQPAGRQKCTDCRHWLTAPVPPERWVEGGCLGPKCAKDRGIKPAGSPRIAIRWRGPVEGQQDLLEKDQQGEEMTTTPEQTGPTPRLLKLAAAALHYAVAEDWKRASKATQMIGDEFGGDGCVTAMLGWADTVIDRTPGLVGDGRPVRLAFQTLETGRIDYNADAVPDDVRWAGRLLAARAADDQDTFEALINSVPDDATWSKYVGSVLEMSALNLRQLALAASGEGEGQ